MARIVYSFHDNRDQQEDSLIDLVNLNIRAHLSRLTNKQSDFKKYYYDEKAAIILIGSTDDEKPGLTLEFVAAKEGDNKPSFYRIQFDKSNQVEAIETIKLKNLAEDNRTLVLDHLKPTLKQILKEGVNENTSFNPSKSI